jgi:hypothetical protein
MCFLGFIRYNKTFIACRYRKYEYLFTHEYHTGEKTREASEVVEYDFCPVWSRVLIFTHCPIKLIYLW